MDSRLEELILSMQVGEVKKLYDEVGYEVFSHELLSIAFSNESLTNYVVLVHLLHEDESPELHDLAFQVLTHPLCHIEGAYASSLMHAKKSLDLNHSIDVTSLENLLFLNTVPEKIVSDWDAVQIAKRIQTLEPDNEVASLVLRLIAPEED